MLKSGAIVDMVSSLFSSITEIQEIILRCFVSLLNFETVCELMPKIDGGKSIVSTLASLSPVSKELALNCLLMLSKYPASRQNIYESGVIKILVGLLSSVNENVQEKSLNILANILSEPYSEKDVLENDVFANISYLLNSPTDKIRTSIYKLLISTNKTVLHFKNQIILHGIVHCVIMSLKSNEVLIQNISSELISSFSSDKDFRITLREGGCIPLLIDLLLSQNDQVLQSVVLSLSNICYEPQDSQTIRELGGVHALITLIVHPIEQVRGCTVLALGNLGKKKIK